MSAPSEASAGQPSVPLAAGRRPTSADVAREAGLSRATVGYVLNDVPHQSIPEETRRRVREAAAKLGYTPSAAARSLRSGRSEVVLGLMPDWPLGHSILAWLDAVSAQLESRGLTFVMHPRSAASRPLPEILKAITPTSVIVFEDLTEIERAALTTAGVRLVHAFTGERRAGEVHPHPPAGAAPLIGDGERTGRLQARHLASRGCGSLAYAKLNDPRLASFSEPRLAGLRAGCDDLGLAAPYVGELALDPVSVTSVLRQCLEAGVDGVACYNDEVAIALLGACAREGVRVPHDLAVIGVDNIPLAALVYPALTTIEAHAVGGAERTAALLVGAEPGSVRGALLEVVVRASA